MNNINIKYQIILINQKKYSIFHDKIRPISAFIIIYILYTNLKFTQLNMKEYSLKINKFG